MVIFNITIDVTTPYATFYFSYESLQESYFVSREVIYETIELYYNMIITLRGLIGDDVECRKTMQPYNMTDMESIIA